MIALVTGASCGIGEALCYLLADQGYDLIMTARSLEKMEKIAEKLRSKVRVDIIPADLANLEERKVLLSEIENRKPDLVINNAGFSYYGSFEGIPKADLLKMIEVNCKALVEITSVASRVMSSGGVIMNVSSVASFIPFPYNATYAATKAFVTSFSQAINAELSEKGVHVLASCPGAVDSEFSYRASRGTFKRKGRLSMTSEFAAGAIWHQIQKKTPVYSFDWRYRFMFFFSNLIPKSIIFSLIKSFYPDK